MTTQATKRVLVVAGLGNGSGTGAATARLFAKKGYSVALVARGNDIVNKIAEEINSSGGEATPFPTPSYSHEDITSTWSAIQTRFPIQEFTIRAAVYNVGEPVFKNFLDITPKDVQAVLQTGVAAAFSFARAAILAFIENDIEEGSGKRGTLIFTGATASLRGGPVTSAFSAAKHGVRALSQSLAKEFGKENIHVAHSIIDGAINLTRQGRSDTNWEQNEDLRLCPESIASAYWYLVQQDRSAWTWELDLRPAHEKW